LLPLAQLRDRPEWLKHARFFRLTHRVIAGPGDENVSIWTMLPPGCIGNDKSPTERQPDRRATATALWLLGTANSSIYDWLLTQRVRATVNAFIRDSLPVIPFSKMHPFVAHSALRLTCNHCGYEPLWREQVGVAWREKGKPSLTWPVLAGDDERWAVRAAIDAVVADAYGLSRDQYAHILSTFSHASYRKAPDLCLARFDELKQLGLEKFTRKHDPYWDIPLNENLPPPVIDLPIPGEAKEEVDGEYRLTGATKPTRRGRKKK
jgi:hypothetical protein